MNGLSLARKAAAYGAKKYRYLVTDPSFFWMSTAARFEFAREWATIPKDYYPVIAGASPLIRAAHSSRVVKTLRCEGYYVGLTLAPQAVDELLDCARCTVAYGNRDASLPFYIDERAKLERRLGYKLRIANHFEEQRGWPVFNRLIQDPWLNSIARVYLGREPLFMRSEFLWTFAAPATYDERLHSAQVLHCDVNDWKTLKVFFYLTDVGPFDGPHEYIPKRPRKWKHQLLGQHIASIPDDELIRVYGEPVPIFGPAGTGFLCDPYTLHRGNPPSVGYRVLLQFEFGCRRYRVWYR